MSEKPSTVSIQSASPQSRWQGLLFYISVLVVFFQVGIYAAQRKSPYPIPQGGSGAIRAPITPGQQVTDHPIPTLMADAEDKFRSMLARQSKTLEEAVEEYKRRYSRDPPKGFDEWYSFALAKNFKLIDEFDAINEDLAPFWAFSGEEMRRRVDQVGHLPSINLVRVRNGTVTTLRLANNIGQDREVSARAHGFRRMIEKVGDKLPDMDFPVNGKAEGRILVPWEHREYPELSAQDTSGGIESVLGKNFTADWRGGGNVWEQWRRTCPPNSKARKHFASIKNHNQALRVTNHFQSLTPSFTGQSTSSSTDDVTFAERVDDKFDFCEHPSTHYQQGHFFSDWRTISVLYPVFSPARAQGYADIRIPSHYYHQATPSYSYGWDTLNLRGKETDDMEVAWENKSDIVFWRGATTGGGNSPAGFTAQYQRHRFVRMASSKSAENRTIVFPRPQNRGSSAAYDTVQVPIEKLNEEIMDVAFVKHLGRDTYPGGRAALRKDHRFAKSVPLGHHWQYKYLVDVDGMGYSGRFFAFLASDSVPLKATVYEEFCSDWLQPWLHYIPLSQNYDEIYNIFAFFSGPTPSMLEAANKLSASSDERTLNDNQILLRRIARAGRTWKKTMGRPADMEVYVYRLALEWARLWSDDRDGMSYNSSQET